MKKFIWTLMALFTAVASFGQSLEDSVNALPEGSYDDRLVIVEEMLTSGDVQALEIVDILRAGKLYAHKDTGEILTKTDDGYIGTLSGQAVELESSRDAKKVKVNNSLRGSIDNLIAQMGHSNADPAIRLASAENALSEADPDKLEVIETFAQTEQDAQVKAMLSLAVDATILKTDASLARKEEAIVNLAALGPDARQYFIAVQDEPALEAALTKAENQIRSKERIANGGKNLWYGVSLGSVLLLSALGLAITFGVLGVINMAHGELIMVGAYTTYVVQELFRNFAPAWFDLSLVIAIPAAFIVAGLVGVLIERVVVRHLYGRPLETLLATWGISLVLQQTVRVIFGPNNREVGNPSYLSGAYDLGGVALTYNRVFILLFAIAIFVSLSILIKKSHFGLQMRAVTQNRAMAANMGISTGRIDALAFGLGAGLAGLAGVALSQIDNVSPNLGQSYIVDSFMVVVFGGAGNLWGAVAGAFTLGIANKFLEPSVGAVFGKIIVLVAIIIFIQKRPRGLFALRGRAVE